MEGVKERREKGKKEGKKARKRKDKIKKVGH